MTTETIRKLFEDVRAGKISPDAAVARLRHLPFADLGFAKVDHHRTLRVGMPEVIFSERKTREHSDIPVAEEAAVTAHLMGNEVDRIYDVGVAGIHRVLAHRKAISRSRVVIVCAGMEGALPSVVGGLIGVPVIAVPTSVGYGAAFQGLAALLGMMNSCASNVSVVNIDNGFGAGYVASLINRL